MPEGFLYYFTHPDPLRPVEEQYITEISGKRKSFVHEDDAMLHLFDSGIKNFKRLTKEVREYKKITQVPLFEFMHVENRIGYVLYGHEPYIDESGNVKRRRAFVWRFIGFGRSCFAQDKEELKETVSSLINKYNNEPEELGYKTYPYYTKHYREQIVLKP